MRTREGQPPAELPTWAVPVVYALVTIVLFREALLGGDLLLGTDTQALSYFARNFYTTFVMSQHSFPLWDPLMFGGLPFIDGMHGDIFYPPSLALFFMDAAKFWGVKMALHVFLAGVFTYIWLRELGATKTIALFGGLVFMMGADLVSLVYPGGDGKLFGSALAPLLFWLTERAVSRRRIADYALFSLGIALIVFTSHMQMAYFCIWGVTLYFFFRLFQWWRAEKRTDKVIINTAVFAIAGVLGVGAAAVQFFPPLNYLRTYSHRAEKTNASESGEEAYRYSATYSLHAEEVAALVVPEFVGDNAVTETLPQNRYWGRNGFKLNNEYAGFIPLFLLPLLFLRRRKASTWFFGGLALLAVLYGLGANTPLFRLFYLIPGVKLFRAPSLIIFLYGLSVATLGAFGLERALAWARGTPEEQGTARKYFWIVTGVFLLLALLAASGALVSTWSSLREVANPGALVENTPFIVRGFALTFLLALLCTLAWEGLARGVYGPGLAVVLICVLAFFDLYRADRPFIRTTALMNTPDNPMFQADEAVQFLQKLRDTEAPFRAFDLRTLQGGSADNVLAVHGIEQMAGHHGNEIGRYRALIGGDKAANLQPSELRVLDLTNTAYVISPGILNLNDFTEVFRGNNTLVYRRNTALPRAYLVGRAEVASDTVALTRMLAGQVDPRTTALLSEELRGVQIQPDPQGKIEWTSRGVNSYEMRVTTDRPALLMVLDNYYPMWRARVDGNPVDILRANYTFRAIPIPAGNHEVSFYYSADNIRIPALVSALLLMVLSIIGFGFPLLARLRARMEPAA